MELCLMVEGQEGVTWTEWVALARTCEAHGIPKLFRSDHYLNLGGVAERGSLDAWGTLCALAAVTSTLRLGTLVSPAPFRHPSELAKIVTTADRISDGRVELGLGAGWHDREHAAYGFPFADLPTRMDVLEEQPPSGWVVGTTERATEQLRGLADAGVDRVFCQHLLHDDLDAVALIGERLAPEVSGTGQPA
jgi:alkanesulfonate monooxygenase SsuD/methylene tetrahydromethanopterin reductase-like flavin-dependent oxidoreductase (luciferase family)